MTAKYDIPLKPIITQQGKQVMKVRLVPKTLLVFQCIIRQIYSKDKKTQGIAILTDQLGSSVIMQYTHGTTNCLHES